VSRPIIIVGRHALFQSVQTFDKNYLPPLKPLKDALGATQSWRYHQGLGYDTVAAYRSSTPAIKSKADHIIGQGCGELILKGNADQLICHPLGLELKHLVKVDALLIYEQKPQDSAYGKKKEEDHPRHVFQRFHGSHDDPFSPVCQS
jgi:hypothetical protein